MQFWTSYLWRVMKMSQRCCPMSRIPTTCTCTHKKKMYIWIFKSTGRDDQSLHESMTFFSWEPQKGDHHFDFIEFLKSCLGKFQKYLSGNFWGTRLHILHVPKDRKWRSLDILVYCFSFETLISSLEITPTTKSCKGFLHSLVKLGSQYLPSVPSFTHVAAGWIIGKFL